jgi:hypothetical protein
MNNRTIKIYIGLGNSTNESNAPQITNKIYPIYDIMPFS